MNYDSVETVLSVKRTCRGLLPVEIRKEVNRLLRKGDRVAARKLDVAGRKPCGYDFNKIILSNPLDGREYTYTCPNCGNTGSYIAPNFSLGEGE